MSTARLLSVRPALILLKESFVPIEVSPGGERSRWMTRRVPHDRAHRPDPVLTTPEPTSTAPALVVITVDELRQVVREELAALLDAKDRNASEWLTADDVAQMLGYRRAYVTELARRHGLPCHQPNGPRGRRLFRRGEIEAWALQRSGMR